MSHLKGHELEERSHREIMVIISALALAMLLAALDQTIVSTALPRIATDLHGLNKLAWVATAYLMTSAISTPLFGKISDQFGRKRIFMFAIIVSVPMSIFEFRVSSLSFDLSNNSFLMILGIMLSFFELVPKILISINTL